MALSARARMLVGFLLANTTIVAVGAALLLNRPASPPQIQGVLLADARALEPFSLLDHRGATFSNRDLYGQWHLVSYGFTTCPDICPTTLSGLAVVAEQLQLQETETPPLRFLFYTVDHRRDTAEQLASYVPFFHPDFIGLTHPDDPANSHLPFEQGLGITAQLVPTAVEPGSPAVDAYRVNHGVSLLLINPQGQLQAILKPDRAAGVHGFDPQKILRDYRAIRQYLG